MNNISLSVATIGLSLLVASQAPAAFTYTQPNSAEPGITETLAKASDQSFAETGVDFPKGAVLAKRVDDDQDQRWSGTFAVQTLARFSGTTQQFGIRRAGQFQALVEAQNIGFDAGTTPAIVTLDNEPFLRQGDNKTHSSLPGQNPDGRDHLVTYQVQTTEASPVWLLFWEDLDLGPDVSKGRSSSDFNDLIVMVRSVDADSPAPIAVPLPPAFGVGLATLGLGLWYIRRRRV